VFLRVTEIRKMRINEPKIEHDEYDNGNNHHQPLFKRPEIEAIQIIHPHHNSSDRLSSSTQLQLS